MARLPIMENDQCESWFHSQGKKITLKPEHLCAGHEEGQQDGCQGDSGGGLVELDADDEGAGQAQNLVLVGVMSAGIGCGRKKLPGVYTRVEKFVPWILEKMEAEGEDLSAARKGKSLGGNRRDRRQAPEAEFDENLRDEDFYRRFGGKTDDDLEPRRFRRDITQEDLRNDDFSSRFGGHIDADLKIPRLRRDVSEDDLRDSSYDSYWHDSAYRPGADSNRDIEQSDLKFEDYWRRLEKRDAGARGLVGSLGELLMRNHRH